MSIYETWHTDFDFQYFQLRIIFVNKMISSKSRSPTKYNKKVAQNQQLKKKYTDDSYYCHYNDAIYMGGMRGFKKNGIGIVLHDNGSSAITSYSCDTPNGHHIVFDNDILISKIYSYGNVPTNLVLRINCYLLNLILNKQDQPHGKGLLIDYKEKVIYDLEYHKGRLLSKILLNISNEEHKQLFVKNNLKTFVNDKHISTLNLNLQLPNKLTIIRQDTKYIIGFQPKNTIQGLCFKINMTQNNLSYPQFTIHYLQRGHYINNKLNGYGQKYFPNGNIYYGNFENDVFEGQGQLHYTHLNEWLKGEFKKGVMSKVHSLKKKSQNIVRPTLREDMHTDKEQWINGTINILNSSQILPFLNQVLKLNVSNEYNMKKNQQQLEQQIIMKKLQDIFFTHQPHPQINTLLNELKINTTTNQMSSSSTPVHRSLKSQSKQKYKRQQYSQYQRQKQHNHTRDRTYQIEKRKSKSKQSQGQVRFKTLYSNQYQQPLSKSIIAKNHQLGYDKIAKQQQCFKFRYNLKDYRLNQRKNYQQTNDQRSFRQNQLNRTPSTHYVGNKILKAAFATSQAVIQPTNKMKQYQNNFNSSYD